MELPQHDLVEKGRNATWWRLAEGLTASCFELWASSATGLAPEFSKAAVRAAWDPRRSGAGIGAVQNLRGAGGSGPISAVIAIS